MHNNHIKLKLMKFKTLIILFFLTLSLLNAQQPILVKDIIPGTSSSTFLVQNIAFTLDSFYFFQADDGINGPELWVTSGSTVNTHLLKNLDPSTFNSNQGFLINFDHAAYFFSTDSSNSSTSIWRTDGTTQGTYKFFDECTLSSISSKAYGTFNNKLYFSGAQNNRNELWVTDGTAGNTVLLKQLNINGGDGKPGDFIEYKGQLYFTAESKSFNRELWRTDGTAEGTQEFLDLTGTINQSSEPRYLGVAGNYLYFTAIAADSLGRELWRTDSTMDGTELVMDINPGSGHGIDYYTDVFTIFGDNLLFVADDGINGKELWITNAQTGETHLVKDILAGNNTSDIREFILTTDSFALFIAKDGIHGYELWRTDGTPDGTFLLTDINQGVNNGVFSSKHAVLNNKTYFRGTDATYGEEIWVSDGTAVGTVRLTNTTYNLASGNAEKENLKILGNFLYFTMPSNATGWEIWKLQIEGLSNITNLAGKNLSIQVYPNPAADYIQFAGNLQEQTFAQILLTDLQGRIVVSQKLELGGGAFVKRLELPVGISSGLYTISLITEEGIRTLPVTVSKY